MHGERVKRALKICNFIRE